MALIGLAGCAAFPAPRAPAAKAVSLKSVCSSVKIYTDAESKDLADAATSLDPSSIIIVALADYARMRAEARACQAKG